MLPAVEDINVATLVRARRHLGRGAAGLRLGNADRRLVAGQNQLGRELALRGGAVFEDGANGAHIGFDHDARRGAAMLGHFLDDQHRLEVAQSLAAELLRNGHAEHSGGTQALDVIPWVSFGAVDFGGARRHVRLGERAGARLKFFLGRRELEIHGRSPGRRSSRDGAIDHRLSSAP
jgi:hypothetical protein